MNESYTVKLYFIYDAQHTVESGPKPFVKLAMLLPANCKFLRLECRYQTQCSIIKQQVLYEAQKFCDVVLIAGNCGTKVPAHRVVLSASSDYFLAMFGGTMKEADAKEVKIEQVDGTTLKALVDFIYTGSIEVHNETVATLLRVADLFQLKSVVATCCDYILQEMDISNCLGILLLADQHSCTHLYEQSFAMACKNFEKVCNEEEFFELGEDQLGNLLSSDDICVSSEEKVFKSLVAWLEHDPSREKSILPLLSHIRFPLLKPSFILENRNSVCKSFECEQLISEWLEWHKRPYRKDTRARRTNDKLAVVSQSSVLHNIKLKTYNPISDEWTCVDLPHPAIERTFYHNWIYANNRLIVAGGISNCSYIRSIECLDLQTLKWTSSPPMHRARNLFGMAVLNGQLYVVGGGVPGSFNRTKWSRVVERYDFSTCEWQNVASLRSIIGLGVKATVLDGVMYAIGEKNCALECYNPLKDKWHQRAYKNEKSTMFGMAAVGGYLYAVGGLYKTKPSTTVEQYDPFTDCWTMVSPLKFGLINVSCIGFRNRLWAFGGNDGEKVSSLVSEYNPETNEWKYMSPMPFYRNYTCTPIIIN